jgi:soluble lytic murein transglycosylase-like protein
MLSKSWVPTLSGCGGTSVPRHEIIDSCAAVRNCGANFPYILEREALASATKGKIMSCAQDTTSHNSNLYQDMNSSFNPYDVTTNHILSDSAPPAIKRYKAAIEQASRVTGVDANLIAAQIWAESRGNPYERSINPEDHNADVGLMQISQQTYDGLHTGVKLDVNNPEQNILAGAYEIATYLKQFHGNVSAALQRYVGNDPEYVRNVLGFLNDLRNGRPLKD